MTWINTLRGPPDVTIDPPAGLPDAAESTTMDVASRIVGARGSDPV